MNGWTNVLRKTLLFKMICHYKYCCLKVFCIIFFGNSEPLLFTISNYIWTCISILAVFLSTVVLVTGAGGFIATHIVKQLQEEGYRVRGTVRSLEDEERIKKLKELCPDAKHELELVEADLTKPESWEP